jgi:formylglycine-generating enzyme required for sulfatase activity
VGGKGSRIPLLLLSALALAGVSLLYVPDWPVRFVTVATIPSGCSVTGEDGVEWMSPATLPVPGRGLVVTVYREGWIPGEVLLPGQGEDTVLVSLQRQLRMVVSSLPSSAEVELDGTVRGSTPCTLLVDGAGGHLLRLVLEDGTELTDSVCLISSGDHHFHYDLPRAMNAGGVLPEMILIPGGSHRLGEGRTVFTGTFLIARCEVTNSSFAEFLNSVDPFAPVDTTAPEGRSLLLDRIAPCNWYQPVRAVQGQGYLVEEGMEDHPVTGVSLEGMEMYCDWLSGMAEGGWRFRLPRRDEWMVAASAGGNWPWPWGSWQPSGGLLNLSDSSESLMCRCPGLCDGFSRTAPVGSFPPNDWGVLDAAGNVWEACSDTTASGGSWLSDSSDCRIESTIDLDPQMGYAFVGFRPAADIPPPDRPVEGGEDL